MDSIQKWRKTLPAPSGAIPYGPFSHDAGNGIVYSIDKFRPRFPLDWGNLYVHIDGVGHRPDDANVLAAVRNMLRKFSPTFERVGECGVGRGGNLYWWTYGGGGIVTLHKFKPFGHDQFFYSLFFEFNPNKCDLETWRSLISFLREGFGDRFCWANTRTDYALDIPFPISDVRLLTRKVGSCYMGTYYFGARGKSGYTRVYDKRKELLENKRFDIGREVTRIEWEQHSAEPVHMDFPFIIQNLGRYEVLRYVPMSDWPAALKTFDERTASKIRKNCLRAVDVQPKIFDDLDFQMLDYFGLVDDACVSSGNRIIAFSDQESENFEKLQSQLRKWAGVEH